MVTVGNKLESIGAEFANLAFNWAQNPGHVLTARDCEMLRETQKRWDDAVAETRQPWFGDLFWPEEDTEDCSCSLDDLLQSMADNGCLETGTVVTVLRAQNLKRVHVSVMIPEDGVVSYVEAPAP